MRPVHMTVEGLRSWRLRTEIDFSDKGLLAIVGPTGAGKSSLLEAVHFALFGGSTWNATKSKGLISTGAKTMTVRLRFIVDGQEWEITRSVSVAAHPQPVHQLLRLASDERYDGETDVDRQVKKLLRMDRDGFMTTVLLRQGETQRLLHATAAKRTELLKGIFGLEDIDRVNNKAAETSSALADLHAKIAEQRALLGDPAGTLNTYEPQYETATALAAKLETHLATMDEHIAIATGAREQAAADRQTIQAITAAQDPERAEALEDLARQQAESATGRARLLEDRETLARDHEPVEARTSELATQEVTPATLAQAQLALKHAQELQDLESARDQASALATATTETELPTATSAHQEAQRAAGEAQTALEKAQGDAIQLQAVDPAAAARDAAARLTEAETTHAQATEEAGEARDRAQEVADDLQCLADELAAAQTSREKAAGDLRKAAQADHVAALMHDHDTDDPCPVCQQNLPAGFTVPASGELEAAQLRDKTADTALRTAGEAHARAQTTKKEREQDVVRTEQATVQAKERVAALEVELAAALGTDRCPGPDERAGALKALRAGHAEALAAAATRLETAQQARTDAQQAAQAADELVRELQRKVTDATKDAEQAQAQIDLITGRLSELPPALRPASGSQKDLQAAEARRKELDDELDQLQQARKTLSDRLAELDQREIELERATARIAAPLATRRAELAELARLLDHDPPADDTLASDLVALDRTLLTNAQEQQQRLERSAGEHDTAAERADTAAAEQIAHAQRDAPDLEILDHAGLQRALQRARRDADLADSHLQTARRALPQATALDTQLAAIDARRKACDKVRSMTNTGGFPKWLVHQRQLQLLQIASDLLFAMSRERYRLTDSFEVHDELSKQIRDVRTLSGGESFMAALALALGMVEMTARAGRRLDCLFVDEGFGSLSPEYLDQVLNALAMQAVGDRLIVLISHIDGVAQRIPDVLEITPDTGNGSTITTPAPDLGPLALTTTAPE